MGVLAVLVAASGLAMASTPAAGVSVTAEEPPGTPTEVRLERAGLQGLRVRWTATADVGGGPITQYSVKLDSGSGTCTVTDPEASATELECLIGHEGLTFDTTYRAQVRASNEFGDSPWTTLSQPVEYVELAPAPAPRNVKMMATGLGVMTLMWDVPPEDPNRDPVAGFEVSFFSEGRVTVVDGQEVAEPLVTCTYGEDSCVYSAVLSDLEAEVEGQVAACDLSPSAGLTDRQRRCTLSLAFATEADDQLRAEVRTLGTVSPAEGGSVAVDAVAQIAGRPLTPRNLSARVFWTPPDQSDSPVTRYEVTAVPTSEGLDSLTCTVGGTWCNVTQTVSGATYTITVKAENASGWGPASSPVTTTVLSVTIPVDSVTLKSTRGVLMASWLPPSGTSAADEISYEAIASTADSK